MSVRVLAGDSRKVLPTLAASSIDSVVTDPPYALVSIVKRFGADGAAPPKEYAGGLGAYARSSRGFMGQKWDNGETAFDPDFWREIYRVLKPGGHVLAFGGTRTYHRLACAIEDAGFEIRDMVAWLYSSGFPKSHDVSAALDKRSGNPRGKVFGGGMGSANSFAEDRWTQENQGRINDKSPITADAIQWQGWGTALKPALEPIVLGRKPLGAATVAANVLEHGTGAINIDGCRVAGTKPQVTQGVTSNPTSFNVTKTRQMSGDPNVGRWPANVIHDGSDEVVEGFPETASGYSDGTKSGVQQNCYGKYGAGVFAETYADSGSAARFFYTAKADATDRVGSKHPTVKPVDLMQYLCRLITPPSGVVLDPFAGSGSTGEAAILEGFNAILIEREHRYISDIHRRMKLARVSLAERRRAIVDAKGKLLTVDDLPLFGGSLEYEKAS